LTGLRPKVFEFSRGQAPTVTIGHVWSIFSTLDASTSEPFWHVVLSRSSWCWHKIDTPTLLVSSGGSLPHPSCFSWGDRDKQLSTRVRIPKGTRTLLYSGIPRGYTSRLAQLRCRFRSGRVTKC